MTARATRNATTINRIVPFAKPAYASEAGRVFVRTATATARTEAVRIGSASTTTAAIVDAKIAKSRHACGVRPSGAGISQSTTRSARTPARATRLRRVLTAAV